MFIHDPSKTLFEVMYDHDGSDHPEQRWKDLRNGVSYYNSHNGTHHELNSELIKLYWVWGANI